MPSDDKNVLGGTLCAVLDVTPHRVLPRRLLQHRS